MYINFKVTLIHILLLLNLNLIDLAIQDLIYAISSQGNLRYTNQLLTDNCLIYFIEELSQLHVLNKLYNIHRSYFL